MREGLAILEDGITGELAPKQLRVVQIVRSACERQIRLVATLLDLSRLRSGSPLRFENGVSIDSLIEVAAAAELRDRSQADVRIDIQQSEEVPTIHADPVLVERAIANLLRNAIVVSPKGAAVTVGRSVVKRGDEDFLRLTVSDQGPGVPEPIRETIFNAFVTSAVPKSPKGIGIGLGLAFAREVAVAHGGDLELDGSAASGATFHLFLPLRAPSPLSSNEEAADDHTEQASHH
jgi:two-component system sensor histidine kinase GlrK